MEFVRDDYHEFAELSLIFLNAARDDEANFLQNYH